MDENLIGNILGSLINKDNNDFGNNGTWIILLFFLFMFNGNGFGGFNRACGAPATQADVNNGFQFNQLENNVANNGKDISQLAYNMLQGQHNILEGLCNVNQNINNGFNNTNQNINNVKYDMAQNTCAITSTDTANTQKILDKLCQMESSAKDNTIAELRSTLQQANLTLAQANQTNNIIGTLAPRPIPAYLTASPYTGYYGTATV